MDEKRLVEIESRLKPPLMAVPWDDDDNAVAHLLSDLYDWLVHKVTPDEASAFIGFVAAARQDVPDLLAEVRRLRAGVLK